MFEQKEQKGYNSNSNSVFEGEQYYSLYFSIHWFTSNFTREKNVQNFAQQQHTDRILSKIININEL